MNRNRIVTILLVIFSFFSFFFLFNYSKVDIFAQTSCPSNIDPDSIECLDYLTEQLGSLEKKQVTIQKQIANEEYQQLSLQEKINYTNNQISQTENEIKILEVEIAALNIEIKLLEEAIAEMEDNVSLLSQEITLLNNSVNKRITESYKYSYVGPFELFLDVKNLSTVIRKSKYLIITRSQDKRYLQQYSEKVLGMKAEEKVLAEKKSELQTARNKIDEEKILLAESRKSLSTQKIERESLLAESKAKRQELLALFQANSRMIDALDLAIIQYVNAHPDDYKDEGWVTTSTAIGQMGNTGSASTGSHLHVGLNSGKKYDGWGHYWSDVNLLGGGYLKQNGTMYWPAYGWDAPILLSGSVRIPFNATYVFMHQTEHQGNALDMAPYRKLDWGTKIEGAAVYPLMEGNLIKRWDGRGGNCAEVYHKNGMVSVYLHLK